MGSCTRTCTSVRGCLRKQANTRERSSRAHGTHQIQHLQQRTSRTLRLSSILQIPFESSYNFASSAYMLVRSCEQMGSCTRTCTSVRYELTRCLCFCVEECADELLYGNLYVCMVRAHNGFMQVSSELVSRNKVFVRNQYACVSYVKTRNIEIFNHCYCLCTEFRNVPLPVRDLESICSWANSQGELRYSTGAHV